MSHNTIFWIGTACTMLSCFGLQFVIGGPLSALAGIGIGFCVMYLLARYGPVKRGS